FFSCNNPNNSLIQFENDWEYKIGYQSEWLDPDYNEGWKKINLPGNLTKNFQVKNGYITLRKELPKELEPLINEGQAIALDAGRILDVSLFFLNGEQFGNLGSIRPYKPGAMRPFIRGIPSKNFRKDKPNYLQIILYTDGSYPLQLMDEPFIGRSDLVFSHFTNKEIFAFFFLATYLVNGLYHILLASKRPKDIYNLYYGSFCVIISIYWFVANTFSRDYLFSDHVELHRKIEHVLLFATTPSFLIFIVQYFKGKQNKITLSYLGISYLLILSTLVSPIFIMRICSVIWQISTALFIFPFIVYLIFQQWRAKHEDAKYFLLTTFIFTTGAVSDILVSRNIVQMPIISNFTFFIFVMGTAALMGNKFMKVTNAFEKLTQELEEKVKERTKALQKSLEEIQTLKVQQDGDYFLTSLLIKPLTGSFIRKEIQSIDISYVIKQKKKFEFRKRNSEIGGDICIVDLIKLRDKDYIVFTNADAMGKSIQGAGGALVYGTVLKSNIERAKNHPMAKLQFPELWLKDCFKELQNVFITFDGSMMISCVLGLIDINSGMVYFINAEHPFIILYRDGKAGFLESEQTLKKIGIDNPGSELIVNTIQLEHGDSLISGSDGKDDLLISSLEDGTRVINEDEHLILKYIEYNRGEIRDLDKILEKEMELTDDFSLIKVSFTGENLYTPLVQPFYPLEKAKNLEEENKLNDAIIELENAIQETNEHPEVLKEAVEFFAKHKFFDKASFYVDKAIEKSPSSTGLYYLASFVKKKTKEIRLSIYYGECFRLRNPFHIINLINLADSYRLGGDKKRAFKIIEKALNIEPENEKALKLKSSLELT
ncbi:MAG: SpoIIE family protein phosphatase, partial [Leptospiraceae bacterium]|nr:SpoIIE family protein phosphatase [Leptospiraceae bacterium]